ncbi:MAG: DUF2189 domain-containing protein [Proteobacteria bacterium]|nr:MAG: DUF2189 domain-containing protein [Pseudomonadota bacterium]QKK10432.1 MAG: DUF2189 domain-containing protein [Pseudomonadota bacterium]
MGSSASRGTAAPSHARSPVAGIDHKHLSQWLRYGWSTYRASALISSAFAAVFALIGLAGLVLLVGAGMTPLVYPWAGGFMLVGPALLCGYFELARRIDRGEAASGTALWQGFRRSPPGLWVLGLLSAFLLVVWLTDAAIIYGLYFGREPVYLGWDLLADPALRSDLWVYFVFCTLIGSLLALIVFAICAFSLPLLYFQRIPLTVAVGRSVRAVFANLGVMVVWGCLLTAAIIGSILLFLPAFVVVFPVLAYASVAAYRDSAEFT